MTTSIAIYTRVSKEDLETPASTRRQERACRNYAEDRGWSVAGVWEDIDISAYARSARRPAFESLMTHVAGAQVDGVLVWKLDRLVRRMPDFEKFWTRCEAAGLFLASVTEPLDTSTELGLAVVRILVMFANVESTSKSLRLRAYMEEKARSGQSFMRGRMFGFNEDWTAVNEDEAGLIREAAYRYLAGETLYSIANDWNDRGVKPPVGEWCPEKLSRLLKSPRLLGHNTFGGAIAKMNCLPAILDDLTAARIRAESANFPLRQHARHTYLLSGGLLRCGVCGGRLSGFAYERRDSSKPASAWKYKCSPPGEGYHVLIDAAFVEDLVTSRVFDRVESRFKAKPRIRPPTDGDSELAAAYRRFADGTKQLASDYYVSRLLTRGEWEQARAGLELELRAARRKAGALTAGTELLPEGRGLRAVRLLWKDLDRSHQHDVIASELKYAVIKPASSRRYLLDSSRVEMIWWDRDRVRPATGRSSRLASPSVSELWSDAWMSSTETAQALGVARTSIVKMAHSGSILAVKSRNHFRISRREVEAKQRLLEGTIGTAEAAHRIGVDPYHVVNWIRSGQLHAWALGHRNYVSVQDFDSFCDSLREIDRRLLRFAEAKRLLGVSPERLERVLDREHFASMRLGHQRFIRRADLKRLRRLLGRQ